MENANVRGNSARSVFSELAPVTNSELKLVLFHSNLRSGYLVSVIDVQRDLTTPGRSVGAAQLNLVFVF